MGQKRLTQTFSSGAKQARNQYPQKPNLMKQNKL